jgi:hypothetical protein
MNALCLQRAPFVACKLTALITSWETAMRPVRIVLWKGMALNLDQRFLLAVCAAFAASWLMMTYVQLLHESVARGDQLRAEQRAPTGLTAKGSDRAGRVVATSESL